MSNPAPLPEPSEPGDRALDDRLQRLAALSAQARVSSAPAAPTNPQRPRRRHPAQKSRIGSLVLSLTATAGLVAGFAATDGPASSVVAAPGGIVAAGPIADVPSPVSSNVEVAASSMGADSAAQQTTAPATTIVNGDTYSNKWGPVQVQATFDAKGSLTAIDVLQTPTGDNKSIRINDRAVPTLNSEALTAQSAEVDTISGATYTSADYKRSLQSAIDTARAEGITQLA